MEKKGRTRDIDLHILLTSDEHKLIKTRALEENMTITEYIRYVVMLDAVFSGNKLAYKILAKGFSTKFMEWFNGATLKLAK